MRKYRTLTKKQLVKWLDNFDDDTLISSFDCYGIPSTVIELSERPLIIDDDYNDMPTLFIKGVYE